MDGEAGWWTTSGNIGLPPLARVMGVGRQQQLITVELSGVVIHSMYKPPPEPFRLPALGQSNKPHIVIGDFNSHSTLLGINHNTQSRRIRGVMGGLKQPVTHTQHEIPKSFNCEIWKKGYNSDLIFVPSNISDRCDISVLDPILFIQHRPICVTVNPIIVPQPTTSRRHFNLNKANCDGFSTEFNVVIEEVNLIPENYRRFIDYYVCSGHIPRGCRSSYIPGLMEGSKSLYEACKIPYSSNPFGKGTLETGTKLIDTKKRKGINGRRSSRLLI